MKTRPRCFRAPAFAILLACAAIQPATARAASLTVFSTADSGLGSLRAVSAGESRIKARHVILFVGDGMQLEHEVATSQYLLGKSYGLSFHQFEFHAPVSTWDVTVYNLSAARLGKPPYSRNAFDPSLGYDPDLGGRWPFPADLTGSDFYFLRVISATDSASAATAWATGYKTDAGNIAWLPGDPDTGALPTIAELMRSSNGASIGVVSTVPFTHATPAAHVAHNVSRNHYYTGYGGYPGLGIAEEIVFQTRPDVVIGGGHPSLDNPDFNPNRGYISRTVYDSLKSGAAGYVFVERQPGVEGAAALQAAAGIALAQGGKLFGLFGGAGGNFEPPLPANTPGRPSFSRGHLEDPLLADATIAALRVLSRNPNGFFLMLEQGDIDWANHANNYPWMIGATWSLHQSVQAAIDFVNQDGDDITWDNTLLIVTSDHGNSYMRLALQGGVPLLGCGELPQRFGAIAFDAAGNSVYFPAEAQVFYGSGSHTDELTMLYAMGKGVNALAQRHGSWYSGTQILDNTQVFEAMAEATGVVKSFLMPRRNVAKATGSLAHSRRTSILR